MEISVIYRAYQEVRNACFSEILACFAFLNTPVLRFALLPHHRRYIKWHNIEKYLLYDDDVTETKCLV